MISKNPHFFGIVKYYLSLQEIGLDGQRHCRQGAGVIIKSGNPEDLGGIMQRLEEDYDMVSKLRPIMSKPGSQTVRSKLSPGVLV